MEFQFVVIHRHSPFSLCMYCVLLNGDERGGEALGQGDGFKKKKKKSQPDNQAGTAFNFVLWCWTVAVVSSAVYKLPNQS